MAPDKIIAVVIRYEEELALMGVAKARMDPSRTFGSLSREEILAHAHYLCTGAKEFAEQPEKLGKANRHLTAIQMCLSFANLYTLAELMEHNRP